MGTHFTAKTVANEATKDRYNKSQKIVARHKTKRLHKAENPILNIKIQKECDNKILMEQD
uniref:Uncharacterized protein n=1 Tax=Rhizophora mucronata TaxID=61149 RepID=A0A2P2MXU2_RHIMU